MDNGGHGIEGLIVVKLGMALYVEGKFTNIKRTFILILFCLSPWTTGRLNATKAYVVRPANPL